jgi:hypothetical protein
MHDERRLQEALRTARSLLDLGHSLDLILSTGLISADLHDEVRARIEEESNITLVPARVIIADRSRVDWLAEADRSSWNYWPTLRQFLLHKGWPIESVRSVDDSSDRVLRQLYAPSVEQFDVRGLVLGYVQSGKTANFTAVIAKAADAGYRLIVVLSGIDNGLRRQTNIRLKKELIGYTDGRIGAVPMPPLGKRWHEFTTTELNGDFQPGFANHAALQGTQPVLLVMKKNGTVLRRLLSWLDSAPPDVKRRLPLLVVDDEADQASVDTRGTYQTEDEIPDPDYELPSIINGLIRDLLKRFDRRAYIAYTATPFANILIPHDTVDPRVGNDLYPKDFIVDLPKPRGYFGAEEIFGWIDRETGRAISGLDVIRQVNDIDLAQIQAGVISGALKDAFADFVLAGAARAQRGDAEEPATMLVHTSQLTAPQGQLRTLLAKYVAEFRDEWRYQRAHGVRQNLQARWDSEFLPVTRAWRPERESPFQVIEPFIGPFLEALQVREVNSAAGEVLDYEREPSLKAIAVGGNRLSRGLTLEGLLVSFFVRRSASYDTLMQMGRWFGFRERYEDLTRIWTTDELSGWFADLAFVEHRLREDIEIYEGLGLTPYEVGVRIWQHPTMQVTSPLKRRFASSQIIAQSYSLSLEQTFKFPLRRLEDLATQEESNVSAVRAFARRLGSVDDAHSDRRGPVWTGVAVELVLDFLTEFQVDEQSRSVSLPLIRAYIERLNPLGELTSWTVAVRGRETRDDSLGQADWSLPGGTVHQISRSRLGLTDSVGVITTPGDELKGLSQTREQEARTLADAPDADGKTRAVNSVARSLRSASEGLLLLYPISRFSGHDLRDEPKGRRPLFDDPKNVLARDLVGLAVSFPKSEQPQRLEAYLQGTVGWRPVD